MQVAPGRRVGQGLKVPVRWASAAPLVSYRWLAIWWLSLKAPHPLYPRDWDVEGVVSAPERLSGAPLVSYRGGCVWWLFVASSAPNGAVADSQVFKFEHLRSGQVSTPAPAHVGQIDPPEATPHAHVWEIPTPRNPPLSPARTARPTPRARVPIWDSNEIRW